MWCRFWYACESKWKMRAWAEKIHLINDWNASTRGINHRIQKQNWTGFQNGWNLGGKRRWKKRLDQRCPTMKLGWTAKRNENDWEKIIYINCFGMNAINRYFHEAWRIECGSWIFMDIYLLCLAKSRFLYRLDSFLTSYFHSLSHSRVSMVGGFTESGGFRTDIFRNGFPFWFRHFFSIDFFNSWYCCYFYFLSPIMRSIFYLVLVMIESKMSSLDLRGILSSRLRMVENLMCFKLTEKGLFYRSKV